MTSKKTELLYAHDENTRVLMRFDADNDNLPIELFNADDMMPIPNPPEGSDLRNGLLTTLQVWYMENTQRDAHRVVAKAVIQ
jgi:hypothetical protein